MRWLSIIGTALWNCVVIFFVITILDTTAYNSNLGTLSALIIFIYASLNIKLTSLARGNILFALRHEKYQAQILRKLGENDYADDLNSELQEAINQVTNINIKFYINILSYSLICVVAIFSILLR